MAGSTNGSSGCSEVTTSLFTCWVAFYTLFLPLFFIVLFTGYRRWASGSATTTHSDLFTLNIVKLEILNVAASCVYLAGDYSGNYAVHFIAGSFIFMTLVGQIYFHDLTCLERYLAVVHPVVYLRLKGRGGVRVRNVSIVAAWAGSFVILFIQPISQLVYLVVAAVLSTLLVCFCTASVLLALIRPRPGDVGGDRKGFDQSKRTALYTMTAILGALLSKFLIVFFKHFLLFFLESVELEVVCIISVSFFLVTLPSSLILPLLFLHRAGKLPKWKSKG